MAAKKLHPGTIVLITSAVSLALWFVPFTRPFLLPLVYLNTHFHESCHALVSMATGGQVERIEVYASGAGVTLSRGGILALSASAGYFGASVIGGVLIACARSVKASRIALMTSGIGLALMLGLFIRADLIGIISASVWSFALIFSSQKLPEKAVPIFTGFLGFQQCLTSIQALTTLYLISSTTNGHSDAKIMEQLTYIPATVWSLLWILASVFAIGFGYRHALRGSLK